MSWYDGGGSRAFYTGAAATEWILGSAAKNIENNGKTRSEWDPRTFSRSDLANLGIYCKGGRGGDFWVRTRMISNESSFGIVFEFFLVFWVLRELVQNSSNGESARWWTSCTASTTPQRLQASSARSSRPATVQVHVKEDVLASREQQILSFPPA